MVVVQPDSDERNAQVRCALDVIAGKDAQPSRVDRDRLVQPELGREVCHGPRPENAGVARAPCARGGEVFLHSPIGVVDATVQRELRDPLLEPVHGQSLEQRDGIVVELAPEDGIQLAEQGRCVAVPTPPEILRQRQQPLMAGRDEEPTRARLADDRRQLRPGCHQQAHLAPIERARLDGLDDQHALQEPPIDQRHAQERVVGILARLAEILEARMLGRMLDDLRAHLLAD